MKGKKIKGIGISSQVSSKNLKIKVKTNRGKLRKTEEGNAQPDADEFGRDIAAVINMEKSLKKKKADKKRITEKDNGAKMGSSKRKKGAIISGGEDDEDQLPEVKIEPDVDGIALDGDDSERMKNDMVSIEVRRNKADAFSSRNEAKLKDSGIKVEVTENAQDTVLGKYAERSPNRKNKSKRSKIKTNEDEQVPQIASVDKDASKGMKKWLNDYKKSRPGLKILQQSIDDFIAAYEAQEEKARKEREAQAAEGGWTVVVHHKGRKKTTDSESGITVGSVAQGAVTENMTKKKKKDTPLDFYRFQKREARRTELMMLQSKFEQDKKRIQQLRAARKFKPY